MFDTDHLEKFGTELRCPICLSLINSAVSLTCNHVFCKACIVKLMKSDCSCPVCKVPYGRREIRATPRIDNLVSIYKSMEVASGVNIFFSQNAPISDKENSVEAGSKCSQEAANGNCEDSENKNKFKRKGNRKAEETNQNALGPIVLKPSSQTKKRVLVPKHPSPESSKSVKSVGIVEKSLDDAEKGLIDLNERPVLSPFFWLRDEEEQEENLSQLAESDQLLYSTPPDVPSFSDLKDSDGESPSNSPAVELGKSDAMDHLDSEMFEWTQRPSSPELLPSPNKTSELQVPDSDDTGPIQESFSNAASEWMMNEEHRAENATINEDWGSEIQLGQKKLKYSVVRQASHENVILVNTGKTRTRKRACSGTFEAEPAVGNDILSLGAKLRTNEQNEIGELLNALPGKEDAAQDPKMKKGEESFNTYSPCFKDHLLKSKKQKSASAPRRVLKEVSNAKKKRNIDKNDQNCCSDSSSAKENSRKQTAMLKSDLTSKRTRQPRCNKKLRASDDDILSHELIHADHVAGIHIAKVPEGMSTDNKPSLTNGVTLNKCESLGNKIHCAFCHSSEDSEASGEMVHYYKGMPVSADYNGGSMVIHAHRNCTEWAPNVFFKFDTAINLEGELTRSRRISCSCCGLKGAALGCYEKSCKKSFHVPCAKQIQQCRWDPDHFVMLCPLHASFKLPREETKPKGTKRKCSSTGQVHAQRNLVAEKRDINVVQSRKLHRPLGKLVLCCSGLTVNEKGAVLEFAKVSGVRVLRTWESSVTHVIASMDEQGACKRTLKVLMGILQGKWILNIEWVKACMKDMKHVDEKQYEITTDVHGIRGGPRAGRLRALNKQHKLFDGLEFYLMGDFEPTYKRYLQDLVAAAGGSVLHRRPISEPTSQSSAPSVSSTFIVYSVEYPNNCDSSKKNSILSRRQSDAEELAGPAEARAVSNSWVLNSIAACKLQSF